MPAHFKDNSSWQTVLNIVIGIALGVAITVFLIFPAIRQSTKSSNNDALKTANDTISTKEQTISSLESKVEKLTGEMEDAQKKSDAAESKLTSYEKLLSAYEAYTRDDVDAAGSALESVSEDDLTDSAKTIYNDVNAKVNEKYLASMYQEGYSAYSKGDYQTAIEKLSKVVEIDETYQSGNSVYYLAQSYRRSDDTENAKIYYRKVLEQVPGTQRGSVAKAFLQSEGEDVTTTGSSSSRTLTSQNSQAQTSQNQSDQGQTDQNPADQSQTDQNQTGQGQENTDGQPQGQ